MGQLYRIQTENRILANFSVLFIFCLACWLVYFSIKAKDTEVSITYIFTTLLPVMHIDYIQSLFCDRNGKHLFENGKRLHYLLIPICLASYESKYSLPVLITVLFWYMLSLEATYQPLAVQSEV